MNQEIHTCDCFTHGFTVNGDGELGCVFLSAWAFGRAGQVLSWGDRLRWCWKILREGRPYDDDLVLEPEAAEKLAQALMGAAADACTKQKPVL